MTLRSCLLAVVLNAGALSLAAQQTVPFNILGPIEAFTLAPGCATPLCAATITVNRTKIELPSNTLIWFPARFLTPQDVFRFAPNMNRDATPSDAVQVASGLALADRPIASFEAQVIGNITTGASGTPAYVAGLVKISQQSLNTSDGYILSMANGELMVGPENGVATTRVRINDPILPGSTTGRYTKGMTPDARFAADQDNATIRSVTGYPMCIPSAENAAKCPISNRPNNSSGKPSNRFTMGTVDAMAGVAGLPGAIATDLCPGCDPKRQAPFVVGDRITYAGTLAKEPGTNVEYVSAHTITAWVAIFTSPGTNPAYLSVETSLIGTGGIPFPGVGQETGPGKLLPGALSTTRLRIEVTTTDPSRAIEVFALDYTGSTTPVERSLAVPANAKSRPATSPAPAMILSPSSKPPFGRVRLNVDRAQYLPVPREVRARFALRSGEALSAVATQGFANGVWAGQYTAPVNEFIFPENIVFGVRPVPQNFENLCFLSKGTGPLTTLGRTAGPTVGPLAPFPQSGHPIPEVACP